MYSLQLVAIVDELSAKASDLDMLSTPELSKAPLPVRYCRNLTQSADCTVIAQGVSVIRILRALMGIAGDDVMLSIHISQCCPEVLVIALTSTAISEPHISEMKAALQGMCLLCAEFVCTLDTACLPLRHFPAGVVFSPNYDTFDSLQSDCPDTPFVNDEDLRISRSGVASAETPPLMEATQAQWSEILEDAKRVGACFGAVQVCIPIVCLVLSITTVTVVCAFAASWRVNHRAVAHSALCCCSQIETVQRIQYAVYLSAQQTDDPPFHASRWSETSVRTLNHHQSIQALNEKRDVTSIQRVLTQSTVCPVTRVAAQHCDRTPAQLSAVHGLLVF